MRLGLPTIALMLSACGSSSSQANPVADAAVDTQVPGTDAVVDSTRPPTRTALSGLASTASCGSLRATSAGFHVLCNSRGVPTNDFAGAPLPTPPDRTRTLVFAGHDGKTKWATSMCLDTTFADIDGLPTGEAVYVATTGRACTIGSTTVANAGNFDGVVARFDATGAPQWVRRFGASGYDRPLHVRLDSAGNAIVAGDVDDALDATSLPVATKRGDFLAKISPAGDVVWTKQYAKYSGQRIATGPDNSVYIFAHAFEGADFGGGPVPVATTGSTYAIVKIAADGSFVWQSTIAVTRTAGATENLSANAMNIVIDSAGGAWFALGYAGYDVSFGSVKLTSPGRENTVAIGHIDDKGGAIGGEVFEERIGVLTAHLAVGAAGTAFFATSYQGSPESAVLRAFRADGKVSWSASIGTRTSSDGIGFDGTAILLLGGFREPLDLGSTVLTPTSSNDTFLARFAP